MKEQPLISVIMPVYNTEAYLDMAIQSILEQTEKNFELIVINDGATDGSPDILFKWQQKDQRIQIIAQDNQGLSAARNTGLRHAIGTFVYFMDSDDYLRPDTLDKCVRYAQDSVLDLVFFDADILDDQNKENQQSATFHYIRKKTAPYQVMKGSEALAQLLDHQEFFSPVWMLFIRRSLILTENLQFEVGIIHEDELFTMQAFLLAQQVGYLPEPFFFRRVRANSIMTSAFKWYNISSYLKVAQQLQLFVQQHPVYYAVVDQYLRRMLNAAVWKAHVLPPKQRVKLLSIIISRWNKYMNIRTYAVLIFKKKK
ncbi:glycosyltransferase [Sphingobacterium faecium]|jgi:glycosyltransferase involved in cell wall biosynthesis|uniref:glycosyltransferase n=1 Tax=Sphingobacterium faecium TaxID=34087 RepID=UPI00320A7848